MDHDRALTPDETMPSDEPVKSEPEGDEMEDGLETNEAVDDGGDGI